MSKPKGFWIDIEKSSYDELEAELNKTKKALRDTANGKPSEWAYVQLKADADKLAQAIDRYSDGGHIDDLYQALKEYSSLSDESSESNRGEK